MSSSESQDAKSQDYSCIRIVAGPEGSDLLYSTMIVVIIMHPFNVQYCIDD